VAKHKTHFTGVKSAFGFAVDLRRIARKPLLDEPWAAHDRPDINAPDARKAVEPSVEQKIRARPGSSWNPLRFLLLRRPIPSVVFRFANDKGAPLLPLHTIFTMLGERGVSEKDIPTRLEAAASELARLRADNRLYRKGPARIATSAAKAEAPIEAGDFDAARSVFAQGREAARRLRDESSRYEAQLLVQEARVDHLTLNFQAAAEKFAHAAFLVSSFDTESCRKWLFAQAGEYLDQGNAFGDREALANAVRLYRQYVELTRRKNDPLGWANAQHNLGLALFALGEHDNSAKLLAEAAAAFDEALAEATLERAPEVWRASQAHRGLALLRLGERDLKSSHFADAADALRAALAETSRLCAPLAWAAIRNNLGLALLHLGERESDAAKLEEAASAFRDALSERPRRIVPLDWAASQHSLGISLFRLGEREKGARRLSEAVTAFYAALAERRRERSPLDWAATQNNLGLALFKIGERRNDPQKIEEAIAAFRAALSERTRAGDPLNRADTNNNLGLALLRLSEREKGTDSLEEAVPLFRAALIALAQRKSERAPSDWTIVKNNLSLAIYNLERRSGRAGCLREAIQDYRTALDEWTREIAPFWEDPR
jgi:tetratricopeptide (TPR) repeat protein